MCVKIKFCLFCELIAIVAKKLYYYAKKKPMHAGT